jgi:hypothetical protein
MAQGLAAPPRRPSRRRLAQLWDIGGGSCASGMLRTYLYGSQAVLLVYDVSSKQVRRSRRHSALATPAPWFRAPGAGPAGHAMGSSLAPARPAAAPCARPQSFDKVEAWRRAALAACPGPPGCALPLLALVANKTDLPAAARAVSASDHNSFVEQHDLFRCGGGRGGGGDAAGASPALTVRGGWGEGRITHGPHACGPHMGPRG